MRLAITLLLCGILVRVQGQPFNYNFYNLSNGMAGTFVFTNFQDSRGYLWIGTEGGLSRYDGRKFVNYDAANGLPSPSVSNIIEDKKGRLWLGTRRGLVCFDGKNFTTYPIPAQPDVTYFYWLQESLAGEIVFTINTTQYIWKEGKVACPSQFAGLDNRHIIFGFQCRDGRYVIQKNDGVRITHIRSREGKLLDSLPTLRGKYLSVFEDTTGTNRLFIAANDGMYEYLQGRLVLLCPLPSIRGTFGGLMLDSKKRLWLNTLYDGSFIFHTTTGSLQQLDINTGLPSNFTTSVTEDKQHTMWLGTGRGLVQLKSKLVSFYKKPEGHNMAGNFFLYNNEGFFESEKGLFKVDTTAKSMTQVQVPPFPLPMVGINKDDQNRLLLVNLYGDLYRFDKSWSTVFINPLRTQTSFSDLYFNPTTKDLFIPKFDHLLIRKTDGATTTFYKTTDSTRLDNIQDIAFDKNGTTWILNNSNVYAYANNFFTKVATGFSWPYNEAHGLYIDQDTLYLFTHSSGFMTYLVKDRQLSLIKRYTTADGLVSNSVNAILPDNDGNLWVSTFKGIDVIRRQKWEPAGIHHLDEKDGFSLFTWEGTSMTKDRQGYIWCNTIEGVFRIDPRALTANAIAPDLQLERIDILNKTAGWKKYTDTADNFFSLPQAVSLPPSFDNITFHFNAINLLNGKSTYAYKLDGVNENWITHQTREDVSYYNLASGSYQFRVKATNENGVESAETVYAFTIEPPFWKTWWFRAVITLVLLGIIYLFIQRRERSIRKKNKLELQMSELRLQALQSQMNPHFIFNSLNAIQSFIVKNDPIEAARYLAKFSALMRRILDNSHHQFQPLDTIVETLQLYVELESFRFRREFAYRFEITEDPRKDEVVLPPMLLQPFVENAIIHGLMPKQGEKNLLIRIYMEEAVLICEVEDNGVGRMAAESRKKEHVSRGQQLTQGMMETWQSLQKIQATIEYVDLKNADGSPAGTRVSIRVPTNHPK